MRPASVTRITANNFALQFVRIGYFLIFNIRRCFQNRYRSNEPTPVISEIISYMRFLKNLKYFRSLTFLKSFKGSIGFQKVYEYTEILMHLLEYSSFIICITLSVYFIHFILFKFFQVFSTCFKMSLLLRMS